MPLSDEEKARIIEEEAIRSQVRRKYEQKSSGVAAVLSVLCPGLGQVYNGQIGKAAAFILVVLIGLGVLTWGALGIVKAKQMIPGAGQVSVATGITKSAPVEMNDEGIVPEEEQQAQKEQKEGKKTEEAPLTSEQKTATKGFGYIVIGAIIMVCGYYFAVKDAIRTARRKNEEIKV